MRKTGCCLPAVPQGEDAIKHWEKYCSIVKEAGFDYSETAVGALIDLEEEQLEKAVRMNKEGQLNIEVCNSLLPPTVKIVGDNINDVNERLHKAFSRMQKMGIKMQVFGCGNCRKVPEGFSKETAYEQLKGFLINMGNIAAQYDVTIVFEPLNRNETNFITTIEEAQKLLRDANLKNVLLVADTYHMSLVEDKDEDIINNFDILGHIHYACPVSRQCPNDKSNELRKTAKILCEKGYDGRITIECDYVDFESDLKNACPFMKEIF